MRFAFVCTALLAFLMAGPALADMHGDKAMKTKDIKQADFPQAVTDAFVTTYPNAQVTGYEKKMKDGRAMYEIEALLGNRKAGFVYLEDGTLHKVEEEIAADELPAAVVSMVNNKHPNGKIKKAEKIAMGNEMQYEVKVKEGDAYRKLTMSPEGTVLASETKEMTHEHMHKEGKHMQMQGKHMHMKEKAKTASAKSWQHKMKVEKADMPKEVLNSFASAYPNAAITGYGKEKVADGKQYEINTMQENRELSYVYSADGTLLHVEEGLPVDSLPATVKESIDKKHPGYEVMAVDRLTKGDTMQYEVAVKNRDKHRELLMSNDGEILATREIKMAADMGG